MNLSQLFNDPHWLRIGWTLIHFLWQGAAIAFLATATIHLLRLRRGNARYAAYLIALMAMIACPIATFVVVDAHEFAAQDAVGRASRPSMEDVLPTITGPLRDPGKDLQTSAEPVPRSDPAIDAQLAESPTPSFRDRATVAIQSALPWIIPGWLVGVAILSLRLMLGCVAVHRMRLAGRPLPADATQMAQKLVARFGIPRTKILACTRSTQPVALGLLQPVVLIPLSMLTELPADALQAIIAHELAHIRRHDLWVNLLQRIVEALLFFHPAVWYISRGLRAEREIAADALAIKATGQPLQYVEALERVASGGTGVSPVKDHESDAHATILAAAFPGHRRNKHELLARVRHALNLTPPTEKHGPWWPAGILIVCLLLALASPSPTLQNAIADVTDAIYKPITLGVKPTNDITVIVKDESGSPIAGIEVLGIERWQGVEGDRRTVRTDEKGRAVFTNLPPNNHYWVFSVDTPNYAWDWLNRGVQVPASPEALPVEITLHKPQEVKGVVVNEEGEPVSDVRIVLFNQLKLDSNKWIMGKNNNDLVVSQTDAEGRFTMNRLRSGKANIALQHPEYANTNVYYVPVDEAQKKFTILKGLTLRGRVSHDGKPVEGVNIIAGLSLGGRPVVDANVRTDAEGHFEIPRIPPVPLTDRGSYGNAAVLVKDSDWASDLYDVYQTSETELPEVTIKIWPNTADAERSTQRQFIRVGNPSPPTTTRKPQRRLSSGTSTVKVRVPGLPEALTAISLSRHDTNPPEYDFQASIEDESAVFENLAAGQYVIRPGVPSPAFGKRPPKAIELADGQEIEVSLDLGPCNIKGIVQSGGKPVNGGHISWFTTEESFEPYQGGVFVQSDGTYEIQGLAEGTYRLTYESYKAAHNSVPSIFMIDTKKGTTNVDLNLPTSKIEGQVVGITPEPKDPQTGLGNIWLTPRGFPAKWPNGLGCNLEAEPDGRFTILHVPPGEYTLRGYDNFAVVNIERDGQVVRATLSPPEKKGDIAGQITGIPKRLKDSAELSITAFPKVGQEYDFSVYHFNNINPKTGIFRLRDLPVGTYGLLIDGSSQFSSEPRLTTTWIPHIQVRDGLSRVLSIEVPAGRSIQIKPTARLYGGGTSMRLRMPSGDWLNFNDWNIGWNFALPYGEYVIESDYGPRGVVTQKLTVEPGEGVQEISLNPPE